MSGFGNEVKEHHEFFNNIVCRVLKALQTRVRSTDVDRPATEVNRATGRVDRQSINQLELTNT
eukprot:9102038-Prorocentrum_lima.AAC.1